MIKTINRLYKESGQTNRIYFLSILYIGLGLLGFLMSFYIGKITQSTLETSVSTLVTDLIILTTVSVLFALLNWYIMTSIAKVKQDMIASFKTKTSKALITKDYDFTSTLEQGDLIGRMSSDISSISSAGSMFLNVLKSVVFMFVIGIGMLVLDYRVALSFLVCLPIIFLIQYFNASQSMRFVMPWKVAIGKANATAQDILNNRSTIKTFGLYKTADKWMMDDLKAVTFKGIFGVGILYIITFFIIIFNFAPTFIVGYVGLKYLSTGSLQLGTLITIIMLCTYANNEINDFQNATQNIPHLIASTVRIFPIWDAVEEESGTIIESESDVVINFDNVSFAYPSNPDQVILDGISFTVKKGEKVGVVGTSGSGKSTILKLINKFYTQSEGSLKLWNTECKDWDTEALRNKMGLLSQNTYLFDASLEDNLRYAKEDATQRELLEALDKAQLTDFVSEHGLDYVIGEKGNKLSGGQRQRLSIARVLLQDSELYLLDEATSALDTQTEKEIQNILDNLDKQTQIVIAHRLSTIQNMNRIIVLDKGKIVEEGSHQELLDLNKVYADLYRKEKNDHE